MVLRLNERDIDIFKHIGRYRLTTREVLHHEFFDDSNINAVTKVCTKLATAGYLNKYALYGEGESRVYYVLGKRGVRHLGLAESRSRPHGPQALISNFAFLGFCYFGSTPRVRLTVSDLGKGDRSSLLQKGLHSSGYYHELSDDQGLIGCLLVDHAARPDHTVRKCQDAIEKREKFPAFQALINSRRFTLGVATSTESRAQALKERINKRRWVVPISVEVVPNLLHVIEHNS